MSKLKLFGISMILLTIAIILIGVITGYTSHAIVGILLIRILVPPMIYKIKETDTKHQNLL